VFFKRLFSFESMPGLGTTCTLRLSDCHRPGAVDAVLRFVGQRQPHFRKLSLPEFGAEDEPRCQAVGAVVHDAGDGEGAGAEHVLPAAGTGRLRIPPPDLLAGLG
jgi:hypothetical protein